MANIFNQDFREFIQCFNDSEVEYILVGGYSVVLHGYSRTTGDLDIWVRQNESNYLKIESAFKTFGMPVFDMTKANFLDKLKYDVFTFGRPPAAIEIMTEVKGLDFDEAFTQATIYEDEGLKIKLIHYNHLIKAKKAAGRLKDLNDIEQLQRK